MSRQRRFAMFAVCAIATCVFWRTAYPTITWWDSPNYSLAAHSLGMTSPPGSLLLTLLGWPISHLPLGMTPARVLNLFAGLLAGATIALVFLVALRLRASTGSSIAEVTRAALVGAGIGALTFAFSATLWEHAIKFTPYILTTVFTGLILWTMLRWWDDADKPASVKWLFLLTLLFGLDFSVHRTNALLIPGAIAWIAIRRASTLIQPRNVVAAVGGMCAGLAVQLLLIPMSRYSPSTVHMFPVETWSQFWSYVSLENAGGDFLLNLWPRKADFWSVQVADFARTFRENFVHWNTRVSLLGVLPAIAGIAGFVALFRRSRSLATAWTTAFVLLVTSTVVYFNIPADFFRPFDRHYLPIFVMFGVTIPFGMASASEYLFAPTRRALVVRLAGVALIALPVIQLTGNWSAHDASRRYFAYDFARNSLDALPRDAIYFTVGDNDTYPVVYLQNAEGVRPDVRIINVGLGTLDWFMNQLKRSDPAFPVSLTAQERLDRGASSHDTVLVIPVDGTSDTAQLKVKPSYGNTFANPVDLVIMDIVTTNRWRRPITFAGTTGTLVEFLGPDARREGLYWRIYPTKQPSDDGAALRANLMTKFVYRGYADPSITIESQSLQIGFQYFSAFQGLFEQDRTTGRVDACRAALARYLEAFPPVRVNFGEAFAEALRSSCG